LELNVPLSRPSNSFTMADDGNFEEDLFADLYTDEAPAKQEPIPEVKLLSTAPAEIKSEEAEEHVENGDGDQQMFSGEQELDDEVDFNLGNGNNYDASGGHHEAHGPGIKEDG